MISICPGRTAAGDVRKELERLKQAGVAGVILDLRDNGRGLVDAVEMAGLFIDSGPIVQVKDKRDGARLMTRTRRVYAGPLAVMVNSLVLRFGDCAAALQDYGRAVIVGSPIPTEKGQSRRSLILIICSIFSPAGGV